MGLLCAKVCDISRYIISQFKSIFSYEKEKIDHDWGQFVCTSCGYEQSECKCDYEIVYNEKIGLPKNSARVEQFADFFLAKK